MKKLFSKPLIIVLLCMFQLHLFSQEKAKKVEKAEKNETIKKHEIKIDAYDLVFLSTLDISYERINNSNMSYGVSAFINFKETKGHPEKLAITPFFRMYFFNKEEPVVHLEKVVQTTKKQ